MKPIIFLPGAEQEMLEAAQYYQEQASGLGLIFSSKLNGQFIPLHNLPILGRSLRASYEDGLSEDFLWEFYTG